MNTNKKGDRSYHVDYVDIGSLYGDRQPLAEGLTIEVAFDIAAQTAARAWLIDNPTEYGQTDLGYQVSIQEGDRHE